MAVGRKGVEGSIVAEMGKDRMKTKRAALYSNDRGSDGLVVYGGFGTEGGGRVDC